MATEPTFLPSTEPTGTAWKNRSGALVYKTRSSTDAKREGWFCAGCLFALAPVDFFTIRDQDDAQDHADRCSAIQI